MRFNPILVIRSTLVMSLFVIIACLTLTRGVTVASADNPTEPSTTQNGATAPSTLGTQDPSCRVNERYPQEVLQWCGWITQYADLYGLSPDLIAALIWWESGGDPLAYSSSGAVGLMQVMPRDGLAAEFQCANGPCFASRPTITELQDPAYNIEYGTRMLAGLYARNQDLRAALKAYGPRDVGFSYADKLLSLYERYRSD